MGLLLSLMSKLFIFLPLNLKISRDKKEKVKAEGSLLVACAQLPLSETSKGGNYAKSKAFNA